jgi:multidrug efflux pump subunit AcrA (membrane-fusion protein)
MVHRRLSMIPLLMAVLLVTTLVSCSQASAPTPMSTPVAIETPAAVGLRSGGGVVVASGELVPAQEVQMGFAVAGRVQTVAVAEGDEVQPHDVLVTLETDLLEVDVTQAEAALAAAQAQQAILEAAPRPGEVAAAEAQVQAAESALAQAAAQRDQLAAGATAADVASAQAQLAAAQAEEKAARDAHDQLRDRKVEDWEEEVTMLQLRAAEQSRIAAEAQLEQAEGGAVVQVRIAQAAVWSAAAQRDAAQAQLDLLRTGATAKEITAAEAAVAQAAAALQAARASLDQATLRAPLAGTVAALEVGPGETVLPGQVVLALADLGRLQAETTDLSERDVAQVTVGDRAIVHVDPLGVEVGGQVVRVASQATTVGGDVVYAVVVALDEQPPGLRWGMSVEVEIVTE